MTLAAHLGLVHNLWETTIYSLSPPLWSVIGLLIRTPFFVFLEPNLIRFFSTILPTGCCPLFQRNLSIPIHPEWPGGK